MAAQEWTFEAQVTLSHELAKTNKAEVVDKTNPPVVQRMPISNPPLHERVYHAPPHCDLKEMPTKFTAPSPHINYSMEGFNNQGIKMECSWHSSPPVMKQHSYHVPSAFDERTTARQIKCNRYGTKPRPKSYHMGQSSQHVSDYPEGLYYDNINPAAFNDNKIAKVPTFPRQLSYSYSYPINSPLEIRNVQVSDSSIKSDSNAAFNREYEKSKPTSNIFPGESVLKDQCKKLGKVCRSTCNIVLQNNEVVDPPASKPRCYSKTLSDAQIGLISFENISPPVKVPVPPSVNVGDEKDPCSSFRSRSHSDVPLIYSTHFCTHVTEKQKHSHKSVNQDETGLTDSRMGPNAESMTEKEWEAMSKNIRTIRKHRSLSPKRSQESAGQIKPFVRPKTIHIDVYCSEDEDDEDLEVNKIEFLDDDISRSIKSEGTEHADVCINKDSDVNDFERIFDSLRVQSGKNLPALQINAPNKLPLRSRRLQRKDDVHVAAVSQPVQRHKKIINKGDSQAVSSHPFPDTSDHSMIPIQKTPAATTASCTSPPIPHTPTLGFITPFTRRSGDKSEQFLKANTFGKVVGAIKKPGHHMGPTRNKDCSCEHCQSYFVVSHSETDVSYNQERAASEEGGDHVGSNKPF